jgi:erythromycin esterase-like protein
MKATDRQVLAELKAAAHTPDEGCPGLMDRVGDAKFVLIGEETHGTHDFYNIRAEITRSLITYKGFRVVAVEADWPDTLRVHRYVAGKGKDHEAKDALGDFRRFPRWMWRNTEMVAFIQWLRRWNSTRPNDLTGVFGMDLYSLHASAEAVLEYLKATDKNAAKRARQRYSCFDHFGGDPQLYGYETTLARKESCEDEVVAQLMELRQAGERSLAENGGADVEERFYAQQNAKVVANAEGYYRAMFRGRKESWNLRDDHMAETVMDLSSFYGSGGQDAKVVVWAHNSHLGDARATEMGKRGERNVGQILREKRPGEVFSMGFTTDAGTVIAAHDWDGDPHRMLVRPSMAGSYERLFHEVGLEAFWLDLRAGGNVREILLEPRLERAIGVIYRPDTERTSHYFEAKLADQFDVIIHWDHTKALHPLDHHAKPALDRPADSPAEI